MSILIGSSRKSTESVVLIHQPLVKKVRKSSSPDFFLYTDAFEDKTTSD